MENFWFISYWFSSNWQSPLKVVITGIFIIQILTLAFGLASVAFNRRLFSITPVVLSLILLALMLFTGFTIAQQGWGTQVQKSSFGGGAEEFRLGFYLILPSLTMFLLALAPNKWLKRETITHQTFEQLAYRYCPTSACCGYVNKCVTSALPLMYKSACWILVDSIPVYI